MMHPKTKRCLNIRSLLLLSVLALPPALASAQSIEGVWRGTEVEIVGGPNAGVTQLANPRLLIYTEGYFMWAFDNAAEPRALLPPPAETSDEEFGRVARQYGSVAGTYIRDGATLEYNRLISLVPNQMVPENQPFVREISTLTSNRLETTGTNAAGVTTINRYTRVE